MKNNQPPNDPFADGVIEQAAKRGEHRTYSYPKNSLPELSVESAPAWSPFVNLINEAKAKKEEHSKRS